MSIELQAGIENARSLLSEGLRAFKSGKMRHANHVHGMGALYRQLGICRLLLDGLVEPLFIAQMQSASMYLHGLSWLSEADKATSLAGCFWDAVAGGYWDAASDIAERSRMTPNLAQEHEDDFLYVAFLMRRYFLDKTAGHPGDPLSPALASQRKMLRRWRALLDGGYDDRLNMCVALFEQDAEAFQSALMDTAEARDETLVKEQTKGNLPADDAAWLRPVWPEGAALLRFAEKEGLPVETHYPMIPEIIRSAHPFVYDAHAWKAVDFAPIRRN